MNDHITLIEYISELDIESLLSVNILLAQEEK